MLFLLALADYDSDGVIKTRDLCEKTGLGASVDNDGCSTTTPKSLPIKLDVKFDHNSYELPATALSKIGELAIFLNEHPNLNIVVEGHTSKVGTAQFNKVLAKKRADSVSHVLINDFNIDKDRLITKGYGFERLEVIGDSEEAHATNRRILVELSHSLEIENLKWTVYTVDQAN